MKATATLVAATMLLVSPVAAPSSALAGLEAAKPSQALTQGEHSIARQEVRHKRRKLRRCIRRGHCRWVWVWVH